MARPPLLCQGGEFASSHNFGNNQMAQRGYIRLPLRGFDRMRFARHFGQQGYEVALCQPLSLLPTT